MRDILLTYIFRPLARPLTRFIVSLAAVPALQFIFRHVSSLERLDDEVEKDLAEWFRGSFLLMLVTANVEAALWHNVIPLPRPVGQARLAGPWTADHAGDRRRAIDARSGTLHDHPPGPATSPIQTGPLGAGGKSSPCWKPFTIGFLCQHLSRSSPVFAILAVIFTGKVGWVCYALACVQYLVIGLATSRARAINVLLLFDEQMAVRRRELMRQFGVINEFARHEALFEEEVTDPAEESPCGD